VSRTRARAALVGAIGGAASGLLGIGGGVVMVPLLVSLLGLDQKIAHGTSLAIVVFTAIAAAVVYLVSGPVDLVLAAFLSLGAIFGARLGAHATTRMSSFALKRAFGAMLVLVAIRLAVSGGAGITTLPAGPLRIVIEIGIGFVVGWLSGLLGVGGGTILVPILVLGFGLAQHLAQGVSLVMVVPTAIAGAWSHKKLGQVEGGVVLPAALASIVTGAAFAGVAHLVSGPALRMAFAIVLGVTGARMLFARAPRRPGAQPVPATRSDGTRAS
jgi:uncharacterized membrane protein YfcA